MAESKGNGIYVVKSEMGGPGDNPVSVNMDTFRADSCFTLPLLAGLFAAGPDTIRSWFDYCRIDDDYPGTSYPGYDRTYEGCKVVNMVVDMCRLPAAQRLRFRFDLSIYRTAQR